MPDRKRNRHRFYRGSRRFTLARSRERSFKILAATKDKLTMYNCDKPDWSLLEHAVQQAHLPDAVVGEFMWMCEQPKGMHQYKHRITRRYANLTADTCMPQLLVREAREGYEPTVPYPNSLIGRIEPTSSTACRTISRKR